MRKEIVFVLSLIGMGASLVVYAHSTFTTKETTKNIHDIVKTIDQRVYNIHKYHGLKE